MIVGNDPNSRSSRRASSAVTLDIMSSLSSTLKLAKAFFGSMIGSETVAELRCVVTSKGALEAEVTASEIGAGGDATG